MMTPLALELLVALHIDELRREAEHARLVAQMEPQASPIGTWLRNALHRLASTRGPRISSDDVPQWPTLKSYPYGPPSER
jgi:hypothetical protein